MKVGDIHIEEVVFEKTKDLLLKYGVKGWNMNDLSEECSMSKRTLYKIIGTKEDLLYKVTKSSISTNIIRLEKYLLSEEPFESLLNNLSEHVIDGFDDYTLGRIKAIRVEYPRIKELESTFLQRHRELIIDFFEKGKREGIIVDYAQAESIGKVLYALVEYNISNCNSKLEFENEMKEVLTIFLKGVIK